MFTRYTNGAEQEAEIVTRYELGAEVEAEGVYAYKSGAEQEVWGSIKYMSELSNTLSSNVDCGYATSNGIQVWSLSTFYSGSASGSVTYYLDGDFSNPHISFDWFGFFNYTTSSGEMRYAKAGSIDIYTRTKGGTANYTSAVSSVGNSSGSDEGTFETTLSGNFDRVGFRITLSSYGGTLNEALYDVNIGNFEIDGKATIPSPDCVN